MKCSRITLFDRKEKPTKEPKHNCKLQREYNPQFNNYLSWLNKPHSIHETEQPYLTVCNLVLPSNASVLVNTGALSERWVKKRPRLQSAKQKNQIVSRPKSPESDTSDNEPPKYVDNDTETDSQLMQIQQVMEEYEIDENVQRLIQEAVEFDKRTSEETELKQEKHSPDEPDKRKHRKTSKNKTKERNNETKEKPRSKLTRTVTLSLSRPPSPETIQVIRVDVVSNYSVEEPQRAQDNEVEETESEEGEDGEHEEDDDEEERKGKKGAAEMTREKNQLVTNRLQAAKSLIKPCSTAELTLHCQKLALADRRSLTSYDVK